MRLTRDQVKVLMSDLHPGRVKSRQQGGAQLSYLEAYDVRATLIRVFGFGGFSAEVTDSQIVQIERDIPRRSGSGTTAFRVTASATVRLTIPDTPDETGATGPDAVYTEVAVASQAGADPGEVADFAVKTAASDALKRCATNLGTQFGLSLYKAGSTEEVVRVVMEPQQKAELDSLRAESEAAHAESMSDLQEKLARATGQGEERQ